MKLLFDIFTIKVLKLMESTQMTINNFTNITLNLSDINSIMADIFKGIPNTIIQQIGAINHCFGQSNNDFHADEINKLISQVVKSKSKKTLILTRDLLSEENHIKIDMCITNRNNIIHFYLVGPDLVKYFMFLPKNKSGPKTGTAHSKWYTIKAKEKMETIALNLRLLQIVMQVVHVEHTYTISDFGILGLEVNFNIPEKYQSISFINDLKSIRSLQNPKKISSGNFLYGKNGIEPEEIKLLVQKIRELIPHFSDAVFPDVITNFELEEFYNSDYMFAICSWLNHTRILIKSVKTRCIYIIDSWMNGIPRSLALTLSAMNFGIRVIFIPRKMKDQYWEGSCVFCSLARLVMLVDSDKPFETSIEEPIDDFYAYFIKKIYGLIK